MQIDAIARGTGAGAKWVTTSMNRSVRLTRNLWLRPIAVAISRAFDCGFLDRPMCIHRAPRIDHDFVRTLARWLRIVAAGGGTLWLDVVTGL
jgi:hypothetical protein